MGAAMGILINAIIIYLISFYKLARILNIRIIGVIKPLLVPLISSSIMLAAGKSFFALFQNMGDIAFVTLISCLGIFYLILIWLSGIILKAGPYATLKLILYEVLKIKI